MNTENQEIKTQALASFLSVDPSDLTIANYDQYGMTVFNYGREEYAVATDDEAEGAVKDAICDSIWAFNASFILSECELPGELEDAIKSFQEDKCEGANDALMALIDKTCGIEAFCNAAVSADGRGHFLSQYDGEENEEEAGGQDFYIYRLN